MRQLRSIFVYLAALLVLCLLTSIGWHAYQRAQLPKYEGKTVDEWVDYFAGYLQPNQKLFLDDLEMKELEVVFKHFETEDLNGLVEELFRIEEPNAFSRAVSWLKTRAPGNWSLQPPGWHDASRKNTIASVFRVHPPIWEQVGPYVSALVSSGDSVKTDYARFYVASVGKGAVSAAAFLVPGLTNGMDMRWTGTLQSLQRHGKDAAPALPALTSDRERSRWNHRHFEIFGNMEERAMSIVPLLEAYLTERKKDESLLDASSVALIRIEPENQLARSYLKGRLVSSGTNAAGQEILNFRYATGSPNKTLAELATHQFQHTNDKAASLDVLMYHDPETAVLLARSRLAQKRNVWEMIRQLHRDDPNDPQAMAALRHELGLIRLLLRHDPEDPEALAAIRRRVEHPDFANDPHRRFWLEPLQHIYSDRTQALEIIKLAEKLDDDMIRETTQKLRRHIELNDQLRELSESDGIENP